MRKTILTIAATATLVLSAAACDVETDTKGSQPVDVVRDADTSTAPTPAPDEAADAEEADEEAPFTVGGFEIVGSLRITEDMLGSPEAQFRVTNRNDSSKVAMFKITALAGDDIAFTMDCIGTGSPLAAGETTTITCFSMDDMAEYDATEIEFSGF